MNGATTSVRTALNNGSTGEWARSTEGLVIRSCMSSGSKVCSSRHRSGPMHRPALTRPDSSQPRFGEGAELVGIARADAVDAVRVRRTPVTTVAPTVSVMAPSIAGIAAMQRHAGNAATIELLERGARLRSLNSPLQRCGATKCSDGCNGGSDDRADEQSDERGVGATAQRLVDPLLGQGLDAGRLPGSAAAHPPLLDVVQIYDRMPPDHKRDTIRALTRGQQLVWVTLWLARRDDATWHTIIETVSTEARTYAVRSLMTARRMNEPRGPWGAYGVLNGLSDTDQLAVLNQLGEPERRILQQGLATAPIDRIRLERQLAQVDPDVVPSIRPVSFPLAWVADELPPRTLTAAGPSAYMASQGAHAVGPTNASSGMRMIRTRYWSAMIPSPRAIELQRILNELPQDLAPWLETRLAETPPGTAPTFRWVSKNIGAMDRPFTVAELQSIPALVKKFNADRNSLTPAEATLLSRTVSLHVDSIDVVRGGSPWVSWSVPPRKGQPEPVTWSGDRKFRVRATFNANDVLDNTRASAANTLSPADSGFVAGVNPDEAEYLATAESNARVLTVEPLRTSVKGELVAGSTAWMARNATQLRWAGRGMIIVSFAISGYRIATADEVKRAHVIGEEAGGQLFGLAGAVLAGAACVGFGIATGGVGLLLCGMAGGLLGGMAGSAVGGSAVDQLGRPTAPNDPFGLVTPGGPGGQELVGDGAVGDWAVLAGPPETLTY